MVFTDPPYNVNYDYTVTEVKGRARKGNKFNTFNDKKTPTEFIEFIEKVFTNANKVSRQNASFYCWHASKNEYLFRQGIENAGWFISLTLYWLKNNCTFSRGLDYFHTIEPCYFGWKVGKGKHYVNKQIELSFKNILMLDHEEFSDMLDVMYQERDQIKDYIHPTQKPTRLAERALKKHSKIGDIVLEPFNGSGSTMMACEQLQRRCHSIELDPKFVDVAIKRWENYTGQKAQKVL